MKHLSISLQLKPAGTKIGTELMNPNLYCCGIGTDSFQKRKWEGSHQPQDDKRRNNFFCRILMRTLKQCSVTRRSANREKKVKAKEKEKLQEPFHQIPNIFYFLKLRASDDFLYRKINFFSPPEIYSTIPCLVTLLGNVLLLILRKETVRKEQYTL